MLNSKHLNKGVTIIDAKVKERNSIMHQMKLSMAATPSNLEAQDNIHNIKDFQFIAEKKIGNAPGVIAKKKNISNKTADNNKSGKKYSYEWLIKKQNPTETFADIIGAEIARFFLGDRAPKNRLIKDVTSNGDPYIYVASRIIEKFYTLHKCCESSSSHRFKLHEEYAYFYSTILEAYNVMAINLLIGNYDLHSSNIGIVDKNGINSSVQAACVDFGKALNFIKPIKFNLQDSIYSLKHIEMVNRPVASTAGYIIKPILIETIHPVTREIQPGDKLTPVNILKLLHLHHYQINSPIFLNKECITAIRSVADQFEHGRYKVDHIIRSAIKEVIVHFSDEDIESIGHQIAPNTKKFNLADNLMKGLDERCIMLRDLALNMELQLSLIEHDNAKYTTLLNQHPDFLYKEIEWLSEDNVTISQPKSNLYTYIMKKNLHTPRHIFQNKSNEIINSLKNSLPYINPEFIHHIQFRAQIIKFVHEPANKDSVHKFCTKHFMKGLAQLSIWLYNDSSEYYYQLIQDIAYNINPYQFYCIIKALENELMDHKIALIEPHPIRNIIEKNLNYQNSTINISNERLPLEPENKNSRVDLQLNSQYMRMSGYTR